MHIDVKQRAFIADLLCKCKIEDQISRSNFLQTEVNIDNLANQLRSAFAINGFGGTHYTTSHSARCIMRKDGRVVEGTGLENRQSGNTFGGSNPSPSAIRPINGTRWRPAEARRAKADTVCFCPASSVSAVLPDYAKATSGHIFRNTSMKYF